MDSLDKLVLELKLEHDKFFNKGVKSSAVDARAKLQLIAAWCKEERKRIMDKVKSMPKQKREKKAPAIAPIEKPM